MIATAYHEAFPEGSRQYEKYYEDSAQFTPRVCSHYPSPSDSTSTRDRRTSAPYRQASGPATEDQIMKTAEASSRARSKSLAQDARTENNFLESGFTRVSRSPQRLPSTATSAGGREVTYVIVDGDAERRKPSASAASERRRPLKGILKLAPSLTADQQMGQQQNPKQPSHSHNPRHFGTGLSTPVQRRLRLVAVEDGYDDEYLFLDPSSRFASAERIFFQSSHDVPYREPHRRHSLRRAPEIEITEAKQEEVRKHRRLLHNGFPQPASGHRASIGLSRNSEGVDEMSFDFAGEDPQESRRLRC